MFDQDPCMDILRDDDYSSDLRSLRQMVAPNSLHIILILVHFCESL